MVIRKYYFSSQYSIATNTISRTLTHQSMTQIIQKVNSAVNKFLHLKFQETCADLF